MPSENFQLVTTPLKSKRKSALYHTLSMLIEKQDPLIKDWEIQSQANAKRTAYYITLQPHAFVLSAIPEGTKLSAHLTLDQTFCETGKSKENLSMGHYTERYQFPPGILWKEAYREVVLHVYFDRNTKKISDAIIKGLKPNEVQAQPLVFPPVLAQKINAKASLNASHAQTTLRSLQDIKEQQIEQLSKNLEKKEQQLSQAFQNAKRTKNFHLYLEIAEAYIDAVDKLNRFRDDAFDPRGEQLKQFCAAIKTIKDDSPESPQASEAPHSSSPSSPKKAAQKASPTKEKEEKLNRLIEPIQASLSAYINEAAALIKKTGEKAFADYQRLKSLNIEIQQLDIQRIMIDEQSKKALSSPKLVQDIDACLTQIEALPDINSLFTQALEKDDFEKLLEIYCAYPQSQFAFAVLFLKRASSLMPDSNETTLIDRFKRLMACSDILTTVLNSKHVFFAATSFAFSFSGAALLLGKERLLKFLLENGLNPLKSGVIYKDHLFCLKQLSLIEEVGDSIFKLLLEYDAQSPLPLACIDRDETSVNYRIAARRMQSLLPQHVGASFFSRSQASQVPLPSLDRLILNARRVRCAITTLIYSAAKSSKICELFQAIPEAQQDQAMGKLSTAEMLLLFASLCENKLLMQRFIAPTCDPFAVFVDSETTANHVSQHIIDESRLAPEQPTCATYILFPAIGNQFNTQLFTPVFHKLGEEISQRISSLSEAALQTIHHELQTYQARLKKDFPKAASAAVKAAIYLYIFSGANHPTPFGNLSRLFSEHAQLAKKMGEHRIAKLNEEQAHNLMELSAARASLSKV